MQNAKCKMQNANLQFAICNLQLVLVAALPNSIIMSSVRLRRLQADYQKVLDFVQQHPRVKLIQSEGDPPERYQIQYQIHSLRQKDDQLIEARTHLVEIALPRNYPRVPPQCRMLTPIFHPNIAPHAICIGDHWSAGEPLSSIVARIGELIAYQSYNTKSPLNGEAARWTDENIDRLPLDPVSMVIDEGRPAGQQRSASPPAPAMTPIIQEPPRRPAYEAPAPRPAAPIEFTYAGCASHLRVPAEYEGKQVRCPSCQLVIPVPARNAYR
jgi:ubiquitin-protein ligase